MTQLKKCKVVMLPTEKASVIAKFENKNKLEYSSYPYVGTYTSNRQAYDLYIISDDEIKEGDWFIGTYLDSNMPAITTAYSILNNEVQTDKHGCFDMKFCKKIIATTDSSLFINDIVEEDMHMYKKSLPQPSQSFIKKFISEYNKGNMITDVLVEYEWNRTLTSAYSERTGTVTYSGFKSKIELKVSPKDNTITIRPVKNSWSREEIIELLYKHTGFLLSGGKTTLDQWIEENL